VLDSSNVMSRVLKPAARRAGVPWVGFHTFRHTCATRLFRRGLNAKQAQVWLGHHSPAFTLAVYVHLISDDLPESVFDNEPPPQGGNKEARQPTETHRNGESSDDPESGSTAEKPRPLSLDLTG
jgi:hypothetical protein